jgi:hypothetical protein
MASVFTRDLLFARRYTRAERMVVPNCQTIHPAMARDVLADIEHCFEMGWSDGLPVVPPYGSLVDRTRA